MTALLVQLDLEPLGPHFGALVHGLKLATATDDEIVALRAALVDRKVLFLRDQRLDDDAQVLLGRRIGELTAAHPVVGGVDEDHPEVYALDSTDNGFADVWHTDVTFMKRPPLGSILRPVVLPPTGGDTNWADTQLAYDSLSEPVRRLADQLTAVHDGTREFGYYLAQRGGNVWEGKPVSRLDPVEHPVVRVHPETGRRGIFVNPGFTSHIVGMSDVESRAILDLLYAHLTKPEHLVRHRWRPGDVALWDNRSTAHYANRDYGSAKRVMHRITLRGDIPHGPQDQPSLLG
ncbi:TauD/TfdA dioxygenase family protein [Micromonospora okii]|uniref:TauD/TfdA dioxygenase family protein n=1 Tax=Micromonospora okii TaxID=1182970 RepID=UPI001E61AD84|nr:TauD/TfdA family dioxygenase [Micromonospora okii]